MKKVKDFNYPKARTKTHGEVSFQHCGLRPWNKDLWAVDSVDIYKSKTSLISLLIKIYLLIFHFIAYLFICLVC